MRVMIESPRSQPCQGNAEPPPWNEPRRQRDGLRPLHGVWGRSLNLDRWVPYRNDEVVGGRIFCFPHAGGNANFYRPLRQAMPPEIDFCPVELPGRAARLGEPAITHIDTLLATLSRTIGPLMTVPFAFFGHSSGASVAYQAASRLRSVDGHAAVHLFISARTADGIDDGEPPLHTRSDADFHAELRRLSGTPEAVLACEELIAAFLPTLRADLALAESCGPAAQRLDCPITVLGGTEDSIDIPSLEAWRSFTSGAFRLRPFPGGHFYLNEGAAAVAAEIGHDLAASAGLTQSPMVDAR